MQTGVEIKLVHDSSVNVAQEVESQLNFIKNCKRAHRDYKLPTGE